MRLEGKKIAVLLAEGFEDLEYWVTVRPEGAPVSLQALRTELLREQG